MTPYSGDSRITWQIIRQDLHGNTLVNSAGDSHGNTLSCSGYSYVIRLHSCSGNSHGDTLSCSDDLNGILFQILYTFSMDLHGILLHVAKFTPFQLPPTGDEAEKTSRISAAIPSIQK